MSPRQGSRERLGNPRSTHRAVYFQGKSIPPDLCETSAGRAKFNPPGLEACSEFKLPIENRVRESEVTYGYVERTAEDIINDVGVWTESLICSIAKSLSCSQTKKGRCLGVHLLLSCMTAPHHSK